MSKVDDFIQACQENLKGWTCSLHTSNSNQPAAIFREAKKRGYNFEEVETGRWGRTMECPICGQATTHYKLLDAEPTLQEHKRNGISNPKTRKFILKVLEWRDAFTSASISSKPEIDHKIPWTRLEGDIDADKLSADEIKECFQLLTREHNLLKDRACGKCKKTNVRTPFLGIPFWYIGNEVYDEAKYGCVGCGWHDGKRWREEISKFIERHKKN